MNSKRPTVTSNRKLAQHKRHQVLSKCWRQRLVARAPRILLAASLVVGSILATAPAHATSDVTGIWYDDSGKAAVQLYTCRSGVCGRIFWLRRAVNKAGKPLRDAYNPSPQRRRQPICGLQIIWGVQPQNDGSWDGGHIYDPKVGKSYNVAIEKVNARRLRITGYLGARLFGKSFIWRRAPANIAKCRAARS